MNLKAIETCVFNSSASEAKKINGKETKENIRGNSVSIEYRLSRPTKPQIGLPYSPQWWVENHWRPGTNHGY